MCSLTIFWENVPKYWWLILFAEVYINFNKSYLNFLLEIQNLGSLKSLSNWIYSQIIWSGLFIFCFISSVMTHVGAGRLDVWLTDVAVWQSFQQAGLLVARCGSDARRQGAQVCLCDLQWHVCGCADVQMRRPHGVITFIKNETENNYKNSLCYVMLSWIFSIITPVFSMTWFYRNHSNMLIYYQCWKQLCCLIFFETCDTFSGFFDK